MNQLFHQAALRLALGSHAPLFHDDVALLVEFAEDRMQKALRFQKEPELGGIGWEAKEIAGPVPGGCGIQAAASRPLDHVAEFILDDELSGTVLRGLECRGEFLDSGRV